jgi:hypothetical protein
MKEKKRENIPDELTEAMHVEFAVDEETEYCHRIKSARNSFVHSLFTPTEAVKTYGFPLEQLIVPVLNLAKHA